jgi:AcrR family transcriptional regulator
MKLAKHAIDRRISRTRALLQHALTSLILKEGYEAITIQDICDEANVGRSTLYAHYTSKDDLKRSGFEHLRKELVDRQREAQTAPGDTKDRSLGFSLTMFEHARDHIDLHRALVGGHGGTVSLGQIRQYFRIWCGMNLPRLSAAIPRTSSRANLSSNMSLALTWPCCWWLDGGAKLPPKRIDAMFRRLAAEGITPSSS